MATIGQWLSNHRNLSRLDAELIVAATLDVSRAHVIAHPEHSLNPDQLDILESCARRLYADEPLAYVTGQREFWGLEFAVNEAVLVPRPETELLVEVVLSIAPNGGRLLDLGTGSGAIAIAIAKERPDISITATDISLDALAVAQRNAEAHEVEIEFTRSDWFESLRGQWDVIASNPPYISPEDPHLYALRAEPRGALVSLSNGLADLGAIIHAAPGRLAHAGALVVEHGYDQAPDVRHMMCAQGLSDVRSEHDLSQIERVTWAKHGVEAPERRSA
jgi:release factor glutamine methyltransferase